MIKWIKTSEQKPENGQVVLAWHRSTDHIETCEYVSEDICIHGFYWTQDGDQPSVEPEYWAEVNFPNIKG